MGDKRTGLADFLYAGAKIGAVLVTINTNYKQSELEYLVENADIHTMCITDGVFDGSYVDMVYTMLPELKTSQRGYLKSKRFPRLRNVVYIGQEKYRGMYNTPEMLLLGQNIKDETLEACQSESKLPRRCQYAIILPVRPASRKGHVDSLQHRQQRFLDG